MGRRVLAAWKGRANLDVDIRHERALSIVRTSQYDRERMTDHGSDEY